MRVNDKVRFSPGFLKATFQVEGPPAPTSVGPHAVGTVIDTHQLGPSILIEVRWADSRVTKIFEKNLEIIL